MPVQGLGWAGLGPTSDQALTQGSSCRTLDTIVQACKQIQRLDVAMCPGISMAAVRRFQAQLPQVICIQSRFVGGADLTLTL